MYKSRNNKDIDGLRVIQLCVASIELSIKISGNGKWWVNLYNNPLRIRYTNNYLVMKEN